MATTNADATHAFLAPPPPAAAPQTAAHDDPVLHRLKELSDANAEKEALIARLQAEVKHRDEKVKELSADKRKEMEEVMKGVVDQWLASLTEVSDEHKTQFREGIKGIADSADVRNPAWEIVCNASKLNQTNVLRIEELLQESQRKDKVIADLSGFRTEAARFAGGEPTPSSSSAPPNKRPRVEDPPARSAEPSFIYDGPTSNAWDQFANMISSSSRGTYN